MIPEKAFKKLKKIYAMPIPHTKMIGKNKLIILLKNGDSAELVGIMSGDGHVSSNKIESSISLNGEDDPEYLNYVIAFLSRLFDIDVDSIPIDNYNKLSLIRLNKHAYHKAFTDLGLISGNKVKNQVGIPSWIFIDKYFVKRSLRGLIDTDGTIQINKVLRIFRITFTNASKPLVKDFRNMCNILGILTGSILQNTIFDARYNKYYVTYSININAKKDIKKFFETVKPKKFEFRKKYYGTWLLILKNSIINKLVNKKIKQKFPKETDRRFSKEYSEFLFSLASEYDLDLNDITLNKVINEALEYVRCVYSKELGNYFISLYKELGSCNTIREFLEFYKILDITPYPKTITNFITKYLIEEENIDFDVWKKSHKFNSAVFDESKKKIIFPNKLRSDLIKRIFNIYYYQKIGNESLIFMTLEENIDRLYLVFLLENETYGNGFKNYLKELIKLVIVLIDMVKQDKIRSDLFIKQNFGFTFSTSTISYIKKDIKNLYNITKF